MASGQTQEGIEEQIREIQAMKAGITTARHENGDGGVPLVASSGSYMDEDIYGSGKNKFEDYVTSIAANDEAEADDDDYEATTLVQNKRATYTAPTSFLNELVTTDKDYDPFAERRVPRIADREDEYRAQRRKLMISPERIDPFADAWEHLYETPSTMCHVCPLLVQEMVYSTLWGI